MTRCTFVSVLDTDTKVVKTTADMAYNEAEVGFDSHSPHAQHALHDVGVIPDAAENIIKLDEKVLA